MSVGAWEPESKTVTAELDKNLLEGLLNTVRDQALNDLPTVLSTEQKQQGAALMKLPASVWLDAAQAFSNEDVLTLMKFFTLAEMQLEGWEAGDKSPVIGLNKAYKQRGEKLDKTLLLWFRENSNNRFIPNGGL